MTLLDRLQRVTEVPILLLAADPAGIGEAAHRWEAAGLCARAVRGWKMRTVTALFDEISSALQFPLYFGENWAAFDECLTGLALPPQAQLGGIVLAIADADQLLVDADVPEFGNLLLSLVDAHAAFSRAVALGQSWDRPPIAFHVVLACTSYQINALRSMLERVVDMSVIETVHLDM